MDMQFHVSGQLGSICMHKQSKQAGPICSSIIGVNALLPQQIKVTRIKSRAIKLVIFLI
jgi:hypothetical protein